MTKLKSILPNSSNMKASWLNTFPELRAKKESASSTSNHIYIIQMMSGMAVSIEIQGKSEKKCLRDVKFNISEKKKKVLHLTEIKQCKHSEWSITSMIKTHRIIIYQLISHQNISGTVGNTVVIAAILEPSIPSSLFADTWSLISNSILFWMQNKWVLLSLFARYRTLRGSGWLLFSFFL